MSAPSAHGRPLLDRFLAAVPIAVAALALLTLLFWQAATRKTPTVFSDELEWSQISRAIAATGHAARRGAPVSFKSLYAYLIAPGWWIHSTGAAYATIKYLDTVVMALVAVPTYLLARMMVPARAALIAAFAATCTSAMFYAGYLVPEVLAYPTFILGAYVSIRALAGGGRRRIAAAVVIDLAAIEVREELAMLTVSLVLGALILWFTGPAGRRLRDGWSFFDYVGAAALVLGVAIATNALISSIDEQWATVTQSWEGRLWSLGMNAASGFAIGLGLLPVVGGLAALFIPSRRDDPAWRAFAAFTSVAVVSVWTYTAVKAAYLSTVFATRVEERNLIYLGPLLIVGCVVFFTSRRPWLPGVLVAWGFTTWLVLYYGYQLDYPYFEAPGYGVTTMANRAFHWDQPTIRTGLAVAAGIALVLSLVPFARRAPDRVRNALLLVAAAATLTWMLAGEITSARGASSQSRAYADHLPKPFDWIDRATSQDGTTFIGQNVTLGSALGINLIEFWNRSIRHVYTLDGTGPGPGPTLTPDLVNRYGTLSHDPGLPYVASETGVSMIGKRLGSRPGLTLSRIPHHPWRLKQTVFGVSGDGWLTGTSDKLVARGSYAYFGRGLGTLDVHIGRAGFCQPSAPGTHVVVRIGSVALNSQRQPYVARARQVRRFHLANCKVRKLRLEEQGPVAVEVRVAPTIRPSDYGSSETRELGAQVSYGFTPKR